MAYLTAMFESDASTMYKISQGGANKSKKHSQEKPLKNDVKKHQTFKDLSKTKIDRTPRQKTEKYIPTIYK